MAHVAYASSVQGPGARYSAFDDDWLQRLDRIELNDAIPKRAESANASDDAGEPAAFSTPSIGVVYGEIAGSIATTSTLAVGGSVHQVIGFQGDTDWFRIGLSAGETYAFLLYGVTSDDLLNPLLTLRAADGAAIASDEDSGPILGSAIFYTAPTSGDYYLDVAYSGGYGGGHYLLSASTVGPDVVASTATTADIAVGASADGVLTSSGDHDWYRVTLTAGQTYAIVADGLDLTATSLTLRTSAGGLISTTTNNDPDILHFSPSVTDVYYVDVGAYQSVINLGPYRVSVHLAPAGPDIPGDTSTTATLALGQTVESVLGSSTDRDWFAVSLTQGQTYRFETSAPTSGYAAANTSITVYDSAGGFLEFSPFSLNPYAEVSYTALTTGVFYVGVGDGSFSDGGDYTLTFEQGAIPEIAGSAATTATAQLDAPIYGQIEVAGDHDWYAIALQAGHSYQFSMQGDFMDGVLQLRDANGSIVAFNDDRSYLDDLRPLFRFTPSESAVYYIDASAFDTDTGDFRITTTEVPPQNPLAALETGQSQGSLNLSVYFAASGESFEGFAGARDWTLTEIATAMQALGTYANVTNLTFTQAASSAGADLVLVLNNLSALGPGVLGFCEFPLDDVQQVGAFNYTDSAWTTGLEPGGLGFVTLIHEFGHSLGLAHPHDTFFGSDILEGVSTPHGSYGASLLNQGVFTTESYNWGWPAGVGVPADESYGLQATPMALDIAVLQAYYGANLSYQAGDNTYVLPSTNGPDTSFVCLWDAGGADEITYGGSSDATIDLHAATLLNEVGGGGYVSSAAGIFGGFTIANGVTIENASGGDGNDHLIGNSAANALSGGAGSDTLDGGGGVDSMSGGAGDDIYLVNDAGDAVIEGVSAGVDTVRSNVGYTLSDNVDNLVIVGVGGLAGTGNNLNNVITGNAGGNLLDGKVGSDTLIGGIGNDMYVVDNIGDVVTENVGEGTDTIRSTIGVGTLGANVENLELQGAAITGNGNEFNNRITGNASNNNINGGAGADTMLGGLGNDTYFVDNVGDFVNEASGEGTDTIFSSVNIALLATNVENLSLNGVSAVTATGNSLNNVITGNSTNNVLNGGAGEDTLNGGLGNDSYVVNSAGDVVNDTGGNSDTIISYTDMAVLTANIENLTLAGAALIGGGNELNNVVVGNNLNNTLTGGLGNDQLNGGVGADTMSGGLGDDSYLVENAGDMVMENSGEGNDTIYAFITLTAAANVERLNLMPQGGAINGTANGLDNRLNGNDFDNVLTGLGGNDVIQGLGGNDTIIGGAGQDNIFGGAGSDVFVYQATSDSGTTGATRDLINDFVQGQDHIDLSAIDAIAGGADDAFSVIGASAFTHVAGQLRYDLIDNAGTANDYTIISMDVNGDASADSQMTLRGLVALNGADFVL